MCDVMVDVIEMGIGCGICILMYKIVGKIGMV